MRPNYQIADANPAGRRWPLAAAFLATFALGLLALPDHVIGQSSSGAESDGWPEEEIVVSDDFLGLRTTIGSQLVEQHFWISERSLAEHQWRRVPPALAAPLTNSTGKTKDGCFLFDLNAASVAPPSPFTPWRESATPYHDISIVRVLAIARGLRIDNRSTLPMARYRIEIETSFKKGPLESSWSTSSTSGQQAEVVAQGLLVRSPDGACIRDSSPHYIPSVGDRVLVLRSGFGVIGLSAMAGHSISEGVFLEIVGDSVVIPPSPDDPGRTFQLDLLADHLTHGHELQEIGGDGR